MPTKLTPGQRTVRDLARAIEAKAVRLRNKAALVAGDPTPGRNLTALRTTAGEMTELLYELTKPRCRLCGFSEDAACEGDRTKRLWAETDLCSACGKEKP